MDRDEAEHFGVLGLSRFFSLFYFVFCDLFLSSLGCLIYRNYGTGGRIMVGTIR